MPTVSKKELKKLKGDAKKGKAKPKNKKSAVAKAMGGPASMGTGKVFNPNKAPVVRKAAPPPEAKKALVEQVCSVTDPFCTGAYGSRLPDASGAQTLTTQVRQLITIPTGSSNGYAMATFAPQCYTLDAPTTNSGVAGSLVNYSNLLSGSVFGTNAALARVVSFGVILRCTANTTNAQGTAIVGETPYVNASQAYTIGDFLLQKPVVGNIYAGQELCWKVSPVNTVLARTFSGVADFTTTSVNSSTIGWPTLVVQVTGGPSSAVPLITAEVFVNLEWTLTYDNTMTPMLPPPKPPNNTVMKLADKVNQSTGGGKDLAVPAFNTLIEKAAGAALEMLSDVDWGEFLLGMLMLF
jgi:hypothetical protein